MRDKMKQIAPFKLDDNGKDTSERASANIVIVSVALAEGVKDGGKNAKEKLSFLLLFLLGSSTSCRRAAITHQKLTRYGTQTYATSLWATTTTTTTTATIIILHITHFIACNT